MARSINRLSARQVSTISCPGKYANGGGLNLQASGAGSKSGIFRFLLNGRTREMGGAAISHDIFARRQGDGLGVPEAGINGTNSSILNESVCAIHVTKFSGAIPPSLAA